MNRIVIERDAYKSVAIAREDSVSDTLSDKFNVVTVNS